MIINQEEKLRKSLVRQKILADIAQNFLSLENFPEKVNTALQKLGELTGVSRLYIFEDSADGLTTSNTYEWCNEGIEPQIDALQEIPYEYIPSWKKILFEKGKVFSTNIQELPDDLIVILEPQGIKSILIYPLYVQGCYYGFMGFDECVNNKNWEEEEIDLLRTISGVFSSAYERIIFLKQLTKNELRLNFAIENSGSGYWEWNIKTNQVMHNESWFRMLGYKPNEFKDDVMNWENLVNEEDFSIVKKEINNHLEGKTENYNITYRLKTRDGKWKWINEKGKIVEFDSENKPFRLIGLHHDIDHLKHVEKELRDSINTKDMLFAIIAQDLTEPISLMMQISEFLANNKNLDESTIQQFLDSQKEISQHTTHMLENLTLWAKFNRNQVKFQPEIIHLNTLIHEIIKMYELKIESKRLNIISEIQNDYVVYGDMNIIKVIIRNIFSNAIKFTKRSGTIKFEILQDQSEVELKISDTGVGISDTIFHQIFYDNRFYTSHGTAMERGTGLGLQLCRNLIKLNNGKISIQSNQKLGTTCSIYIPLAKNI